MDLHVTQPREQDTFHQVGSVESRCVDICTPTCAYHHKYDIHHEVRFRRGRSVSATWWRQ